MSSDTLSQAALKIAERRFLDIAQGLALNVKACAEAGVEEVQAALSISPPAEALQAGVEAQGRLRAYLIKQAALCQQRSAAFASRAAGWVEELNHRLDCGYSDGAVDAASRQASEFQRYSAQEYQEAEMFMSGLLGHSAALTSAPAPEDRT